MAVSDNPVQNPTYYQSVDAKARLRSTCQPRRPIPTAPNIQRLTVSTAHRTRRRVNSSMIDLCLPCSEVRLVIELSNTLLTV
jgi:hypothetical protein